MEFPYQWEDLDRKLWCTSEWCAVLDGGVCKENTEQGQEDGEPGGGRAWTRSVRERVGSWGLTRTEVRSPGGVPGGKGQREPLGQVCHSAIGTAGVSRGPVRRSKWKQLGSWIVWWLKHSRQLHRTFLWVTWGHWRVLTSDTSELHFKKTILTMCSGPSTK